MKDFGASIIILVFWNIVIFALYGVDKYLAKHNLWRISEKILVSVALALGGIGGFLGMFVFRHKTKNIKFKIIMPIAVIVTILPFFIVNL